MAESNSERMVKTSQHLPKLCLRIQWYVFGSTRRTQYTEAHKLTYT